MRSENAAGSVDEFTRRGTTGRVWGARAPLPVFVDGLDAAVAATETSHTPSKCSTRFAGDLAWRVLGRVCASTQCSKLKAAAAAAEDPPVRRLALCAVNVASASLLLVAPASSAPALLASSASLEKGGDVGDVDTTSVERVRTAAPPPNCGAGTLQSNGSDS